MRFIIILILVLSNCQSMIGQDDVNKETDSLYREDQFYFGITFNLLDKMPEGMSQNGFSSGFHLGIIRDMPINKSRTLAVGLGLGYSANSFNQNLLISKDQQGVFNYELLESSTSSFTKNKFSLHLIEIPFELRWRTSTANTYNFWRIYSGFKIGYVFSSTSKFIGSPQDIKLKNIDDFNRIHYGLTLSVGYNTWNAYLYYGLNPIFKEKAKIDGNSIDLNAIKIGLIFYIL